MSVSASRLPTDVLRELAEESLSITAEGPNTMSERASSLNIDRELSSRADRITGQAEDLRGRNP